MLFPDYLLWKKTEQAEAKNPERRNLIFKIKAEYSTTLAILNYHKKKKKLLMKRCIQNSSLGIIGIYVPTIEGEKTL